MTSLVLDKTSLDFVDDSGDKAEPDSEGEAENRLPSAARVSCMRLRSIFALFRLCFRESTFSL